MCAVNEVLKIGEKDVSNHHVVYLRRHAETDS